MAKLIADVFGVVTGEVYPKIIAAGADCPPELEDAALAIGALESEPAVVTLPVADTKAEKKAPENKSDAKDPA